MKESAEMMVEVSAFGEIVCDDEDIAIAVLKRVFPRAFELPGRLELHLPEGKVNIFFHFDEDGTPKLRFEMSGDLKCSPALRWKYGRCKICGREQ